jgi:hypothetical protein
VRPGQRGRREFVVLGVADQRPRRIVGTQVWPQIEVARKSLNQRIHLTTHWEEFLTAEGRVLVITVPRHAYGLPAAWDGRAWMRENDSLMPLSEARRKVIWEEIGRDFSAEPCPGLTINDLNPAALDSFRRAWGEFLRARREDAGQRDAERIDGLSHQQLLRDTELLQTDGFLTNAALILFGTRPGDAQTPGSGRVGLRVPQHPSLGTGGLAPRVSGRLLCVAGSALAAGQRTQPQPSAILSIGPFCPTVAVLCRTPGARSASECGLPPRLFARKQRLHQAHAHLPHGRESLAVCFRRSPWKPCSTGRRLGIVVLPRSSSAVGWWNAQARA